MAGEMIRINSVSSLDSVEEEEEEGGKERLA